MKHFQETTQKVRRFEFTIIMPTYHRNGVKVYATSKAEATDILNSAYGEKCKMKGIITGGWLMTVEEWVARDGN